MNWSDPKEQAFRLMATLGITRADVYFQGGHDEGGVDEIYVWKGEEKTEIPVVYDGDNIEWDEESKTWKAKKEEEKSDLEKLSVLLQGPVYAEYDSFAGEFYVNGVVRLG